MKQLTCEMCGSTDLIKQDGIFVCQTCGTKYSVEEAKKMMVEGTVEVKVNQTENVQALLKRAYNFLEEKRFQDARNYSERILDIEPENAYGYLINLMSQYGISQESDWANVYISKNDPTYRKVLALADSALKEHIQRLYQTIRSPFIIVDGKLIRYINTGYDPEVIIPDGVRVIGENVFYEHHNIFKIVIPDSVYRIEKHAFYGCCDVTCFIMGKNVKYIGQGSFFGCCSIEEIIIPHSVSTIDQSAFWCCGSLEKVVIENKSTVMVAKPFDYCDNLKTIIRAGKQITPRELYPKSNGGCYVATCVYGSYDCPQVWTLRRFRDDTLGASWYGRLFIHTYYAISPTLVKWFGHTKWFKKMWKGTLDRMVSGLRAKGVEDTPYNDIEWRRK